MAPTDCGKISVTFLFVALAGCVAPMPEPAPLPPLTLELTRLSDERISAEYLVREPTDAFYFPRELGGYRAESWRSSDSAFRWVKEGNGERFERADGALFDRVSFVIPIDYREMPKSYAPFSPFSDGSSLVHSGQFHACVTAPCEKTNPLPVTIEATGQTIGVDGRRTPNRERFVSRDEGTKVFVGMIQPVDDDGFVAVLDPGLPDKLRRHLGQSLPQAMQLFAETYGSLSFTPELYVSIDDEPEINGRISTEGGTLPNQIFMHFDGENARQRLSSGEPYWLDWFFAHEAAHLFQQDKAGSLAADDAVAWLHEGGADAMAALALMRRGEAERSYAQARVRETQAACARGLATSPLSKATVQGNFDLHYQCGLLIWLALNHELRRAGAGRIHDFNRAFFAAVRGGKSWSEQVFLETARQQGASNYLISQITALNGGGYTVRASAIEEIGRMAHMSLAANKYTRARDWSGYGTAIRNCSNGVANCQSAYGASQAWSSRPVPGVLC